MMHDVALTNRNGGSDLFAPDIDTAIYPSFIFLKSIHNIVIEAFWHWLCKKVGYNLKDYILQGKHNHIFQPQVQFHA